MAQPPTISKGWFTASVAYFLGWHWDGWVFPLKSLWIFFETPRHFRRFSFPLWLGGIHCTALCEFGLATYGWCCSGKVGKGSIGATERGGFAGGHSGKPPTIMAGQPTPAKVPPSEIRGLIAGLIKGNQWSISRPYFWGGVPLGGVGWPAMKPPLKQQKLHELGQKEGIGDNDQIHNAYNN